MPMRGDIPVPGRGDKMRAAWGAAVAGRLNGLCSLAPAGMLARDGLGGTGAEPLPRNLRERRAAALPSPGCWRLELRQADPEDPEPRASWHLVACWYNVGGETDMAEDTDVQDLIDSIVAEEGDEAPPTRILCAVFARGGDVSAELYADLAALNSAQEDATKYIVPLYVLGEGGTVVTDLRNAPQVQIFEDTL